MDHDEGTTHKAGAVGLLISAAGQRAPLALEAALVDAGQMFQARAGHLLLAAGTRSDDVYIMRSGRVRVTLFSNDGREVVMRELLTGAMFGELAAISGGLRSASIVAIEASQLLVVSGEVFRGQITGDPEAASWFASHLAGQILSLTERVFELSTLNVRGRLHSQLLRMCATAGVTANRAVIDPAPTHDVLATMIGSHREAVTRELSYLASVSVVRLGRRRLEVDNVTALSMMVRKAAGDASEIGSG